MTHALDRRLITRFRRFSAAAGIAIVAMGCVVLAGWWLDIEPLKAVIGYVYSSVALIGLDRFIPMAINTAAALVVLSTGVLVARPDRGIMATLTSNAAGGVTARRLLPAAILVPLVLGWLCWQGELHAVYDRVSGVSLFALAALQRQPFDVVLMDVQMPEMDGLAATAAIRQREQATGRRTPIAAMTAHAMKGDRQRCLEAGMDAYVSKPVRAQELFDAIDGLLGQPQSPATAREADAIHDPVDWDQAMLTTQGDHALLRSMVAAFLNESSGLLAGLRDAVERRDTEALRLTAHTLLGSLRYFGARTAVKALGELEQCARANDLSGAEDLAGSVEQQVADVIRSMEEFIASTATERKG